MREYVLNMETLKLELHLDKAEYMALSEDQKKAIKNNFLFSRNGWVSRAKFPNLYRAESVAMALGLTDGGKCGDTLTFAEQMERKAERAEARAERYEVKSANAVENAKALQKPINDMHGDIAFFTQPNINSSAGRAFTRKRDKMFAAWDKGFEEFKKSEYYAERAAIARQTASDTKPTDKGFIDRRIKDAEKTIQAQKKNLEHYHHLLEEVERGKIIKRYDGTILSIDEISKWVEKAELLIENAISKSVYYHELLAEAGGVAFSQENIKVGYVVEIARWGNCKVTGTGKVNIGYEILNGGAAGLGGKAAYAEIKRIVSAEVQIDPHPFKIGEVYTVKVWDGKDHVDKTYTITKVTNQKVTLKSGSDRAITRKPRKFRDGNAYGWAIGIVDGLNGTIYKRAADITQ